MRKHATGWTACAVLLAMTGCGGGSGGIVTPPNPPPTGQNVVSLVVDAGPAALPLPAANTAYVTVTICAPTTTTCQTIDHISVDTQSSGLRVISSVLTTALAQALPQMSDSSSQPLVECLTFADGYSWGPVKSADIKIAGEEGSSVPIQVIGDSAYSTVPATCSGTGVQEDTVASFGANGILGVSVFQQDCGSGCVSSTTPGLYYGCPASGCVQTTATLAQQVQNPVFHFAGDNNGVIVELPSIGSAGAASVTGSLVFGIDTQSNNQLGTATLFSVDAGGNLVTMFNNQSLTSFIDSGSNGFFFPSSLATCSGGSAAFYCPSSTQSLSATFQSASGNATKGVSFSITSADTLFTDNPSFTAFNDLGGPATGSIAGEFDWGLPFFFGRNVFVAIEGQNTSAGMGPYVAF